MERLQLQAPVSQTLANEHKIGSKGVSKNHGNNAKTRIKYKIEFPPGAMGLELEPVIKSTEREVGCRVKDFYFSLDHQGIDPTYIEKRVNIGDIICSINGEDIKSLPFNSIIEKLRDLRETKRVISFKNITAACKPIPPSLMSQQILLFVFSN